MTAQPAPKTRPSRVHEAFDFYGEAGGAGPVLFAVPHAGRCYAPALLARARVAPEVLMRLEDRHADRLADGLIDKGHCVLVARQPRALIDLNRDETDVDVRAIADAPWSFRGQPSAKVRGGLGLIPERLAHTGNLWREALPFAELRRRIEQVHRPYHHALGEALETARQRHGVALLIDIHSMPPLRQMPGMQAPAPRIVIGDRFGRSATDRLTDLCADIVRRHALPVAINAPYPGNHILARHGRPGQGIHAIQIEVDRSLYLAPDLMTPGPGLSQMQRLLSDLATIMTQDLFDSGFPLAAE